MEKEKKVSRLFLGYALHTERKAEMDEKREK